MTFYFARKIIRKLPGKVIRAVPLPQPEVTEGFGSRDQTGRILRELGLKSALLVSDRTLCALGLQEKVQNSLCENGISCALFGEIDSEPTVDLIRAGKKAAVDCAADCVIALGGGSVLDSCKIIAASARHPKRDVGRYLRKFAYVRGGTLPMISIPSTAGTGAEHTVGAVVKNARGVKHSTVLLGLRVPRVILDSELMIGAPQGITVWCGIDALSHGLEGLLSDTKSSEEDLEKSRACVRLVLENLPKLLENPKDISARQAMSLAAYYGGNAINKQLAGYVHAFAHSIGALYHIAHGKAIAYCLLPVLEFQKELSEKKLAALSADCGLSADGQSESEAAERFLEALRNLLERCGLEKGCEAIRPEDEAKLVKMIDSDSINYSPAKTFRDEEIRTILSKIRKGA